MHNGMSQRISWSLRTGVHGDEREAFTLQLVRQLHRNCATVYKAVDVQHGKTVFFCWMFHLGLLGLYDQRCRSGPSRLLRRQHPHLTLSEPCGVMPGGSQMSSLTAQGVSRRSGRQPTVNGGRAIRAGLQLAAGGPKG